MPPSEDDPSDTPEAPPSDSAGDGPEGTKRRRGFFRRFWRPLLLVALIGIAWGLGVYFDIGEYLTRDRIRAWVARSGWWGPLVFVGLFTVGQLISIPGLLFVAAAVVAWGKWPGIGASYLATIVSSTVGFLVARLVGGKAFHRIRWKWMQSLLDRVEEHPLRWITLIVAVLWMAPPVNYALGMTKVPLWRFVVATAVGLIPGLLATGFFFDWISRTFL